MNNRIFENFIHHLNRTLHIQKYITHFIYILYFTLGAHFFIYTCCFFYSLYRIDYSYIPHNPLFRLFALIIPPIIWITGTYIEQLNYYTVKLCTYILVSCCEIIILTGIIFQLLSQLFLPHIMLIHTDDIFTKNMVLFLARLITELPLLPFCYLCFKIFLRPIKKEEKSRYDILSFKISNYVAQCNNSKTISYPLSIAREMSTGKFITIAEKDRFLHTLVDGTSGTGKTSSTILPAIKDDLNMRCTAESAQISQLQPLLNKQLINYINNKNFFSINNFQPSKDLDQKEFSKIEKELDHIRINYPVCGLTILAPDDSLTDDVCALCDVRKIPYHRIDASKTESGEKKSNWTGMNPFHLSAALNDEQRYQAIVKKAIVFSDVLQVITDLKGKADSYFTGLNRQMITNLSILVMNTVPILHQRNATPEDLQELINNFDLLPNHVNQLEVLDATAHRYSFIVQYIKEDLLGKGRVKMEDQSRGTRNIINEFLLMPNFREVYCSQESIDFEQILKNGEITICNYDLASGDNNAIAFGLFFLLSFNNAVLSRPGNEKTRTPHFFYIDELPVLLHSSIEKNFSLFRKFRVAMFCAIQTIDQFEKNELTKYLKGVVLGSAHIFVFGRSSLSDMKIFSTMSGIHDSIDEQSTTSETALSSDSPVLSYSSREIVTQKSVLEEIDIRLRDFQEITLFTTRNGRPLPPLHAKVSFLNSSDWDASKVPVSHSDFITHCKESTKSSDKMHSSMNLDKKDSFEHKNQISTTNVVSYQKSFFKDKNTCKPDTSLSLNSKKSEIPNGSESIDDLF